jgi:diguanylate cyclase (GGDEF)-like protein
MSPLAGSSSHQLAEFLAAVSAFADERAATIGALERTAAAFEAEVAVLINEGSVQASIGFRDGEVPEAPLLAAAKRGPGPCEIPGLGPCHTASVPLKDSRAGTLVLVRLGEDAFAPEELNLLWAMARVLELALRMLRALEEERGLRHRAEEHATERRRAERLLATQHAVARLLAGSATAEGAFVPVLRTLVSELGCAFGAVWLANEEAQALECGAVWEPASAGSEDGSPPPSCPRGEGLAGRVWMEGVAVWKPCRETGTADETIRAAVAFPIPDGSELLGVIELAGEDLKRPDSAALEMLNGVGVQVGQFVTRRRAEAKLAHQAFHDPLTGLPNRALLLDRLEHARERAIRNRTSIGVLFLDIDRFKDTNDSLGHHAGDRLLVAFANRLSGVMRTSDTVTRMGGTVARLGGDEFVVLCEDLRSERDAVRVADRIADAAAAPFTVDGNDLRISVSIGIAVARGGDSQPEQLIRDADIAMYRAKETGRNRYELFDAPMRTRVLERIDLEKDLETALARGQLELHYQPIVWVGDGSFIGCEALLRWQHPRRGLVAPLEFISVAEETGLILPIGEWVAHTACRQLADWLKAAACPRDFSMAVNLSPRQLTPELPGMIAATISAAGIDPSALSIEITESLLIDDAESPIELLRALKSVGVHLVLDDFGTGYSSLSYLHRFALDSLKLDRSFIARLGDHSSGSKLVAAAIEMARALDLSVVAEGVETEQQLNCLRELSCSLAQGYFFARPSPAAEFESLLRRQPRRSFTPRIAAA